jgi:transcriptional regulator with XRE-family HTH domain
MTEQPTITMQKRQLGNELRKLREAAGLNQDEAAHHIGKAPNKISRVENGGVGISKLELDSLLELYNASPKDRLWCRELAKESRPKRGRAANQSTLYLGPQWFRAFRDFERDAREILTVGSEVIPGLLQTPAYIRGTCVGRGDDPTDTEVENIVRVRQERQQILARENPPAFSFIISESSLRRVIGSRAVMAQQLTYLAEVAQRPNIAVQVIPFDALSYDAPGTDFVVFRFDPIASNDILYIEIYEDALYPKSADFVHRYVELHARLQRGALGPLESRNFISRLAREFAGNTT